MSTYALRVKDNSLNIFSSSLLIIKLKGTIIYAAKRTVDVLSVFKVKIIYFSYLNEYIQVGNFSMRKCVLKFSLNILNK